MNVASILGPKLPILLHEIAVAEPMTYIEIGCYRCYTLREVLIRGVPRGIGFDLFEDAQEHYQHIRETGAGEEDLPLDGPPISFEEAKAQGLEVYKGNTHETLSNLANLNIIEPVFVFLDGGHSEDTVRNDWCVVHETFPFATVVFDDAGYPGVAAVIRQLPLEWKTWLGYDLIKVRATV